MKITVHHIQNIQTAFEGKIVQNSSRRINVTSYIIQQLAGSVYMYKTGK